MTVEDYAKYINVLHEHALVEDDLRTVSWSRDYDESVRALADMILYERFGVDSA